MFMPILFAVYAAACNVDSMLMYIGICLWWVHIWRYMHRKKTLHMCMYAFMHERIDGDVYVCTGCEQKT